MHTQPHPCTLPIEGTTDHCRGGPLTPGLAPQTLTVLQARPEDPRDQLPEEWGFSSPTAATISCRGGPEVWEERDGAGATRNPGAGPPRVWKEPKCDICMSLSSGIIHRLMATTTDSWQKVTEERSDGDEAHLRPRTPQAASLVDGAEPKARPPTSQASCSALGLSRRGEGGVPGAREAPRLPRPTERRGGQVSPQHWRWHVGAAAQRHRDSGQGPRELVLGPRHQADQERAGAGRRAGSGSFTKAVIGVVGGREDSGPGRASQLGAHGQGRGAPARCPFSGHLKRGPAGAEALQARGLRTPQEHPDWQVQRWQWGSACTHQPA